MEARSGSIIHHNAYEQGKIALLRNRPEEAREFFLQETQSESPNLSVYLYLIEFSQTPEESQQWKDKIDSKAIKWFQKKADAGDADAQNSLGFCYQQGLVVPKNPQHALNKALIYYQFAADRGHAIAQYNLGTCFDNEKKMKEALHYFFLAAKNGYVDAMFWLFKYHLGHRNPQEAMSWFENAAKASNNADHFLSLAQIYYDGTYNDTVMLQDYEKAVLYFQLAADKYRLVADKSQSVADKENVMGCCFCLGHCYANGLGVNKDVSAAVQYYLDVLTYSTEGTEETTIAYVKLGELYFQLEDYKNAVSYFNCAAGNKHPPALVQLGHCYKAGKGVTQDLVRAFQCYQMAAAQKDPNGQTEVGCCYLMGIGIEQNSEKGIFYLTLAAKQGYHVAEHNLAMCYSLQPIPGVNQDWSKALNHFKAAVNAGCLDSMYMLARIYYTGVRIATTENYLIPKDVEKAKALLEQASAQGHQLSTNWLARLFGTAFNVGPQVRLFPPNNQGPNNSPPSLLPPPASRSPSPSRLGGNG